MLKRLYIVSFLILISSTFCIGQRDSICSFENEKMIFEMNRAWSAAQIERVEDQYGLDSLLIAKAFMMQAAGEIMIQNIIWHIDKFKGQTFRIWKDITDMPGSLSSSKHILIQPGNFPFDFYERPGYVNQANVIFGVNRFTQDNVVVNKGERFIFKLYGFSKIDEISLSGSFNDWATDELKMEKTIFGWQAELYLKPGKYLYKYLIDGRWTEDPANQISEKDGYEDANSVYYVTNHRFSLSGYPNARTVILSGDFNNWDEKEYKMKKSESVWELPVYLKDGTYAYKFIVDGEWITDPANPKIQPDNEGNFNSSLSIGETTRLNLKGFQKANQVALAGSFNDWNPGNIMMDKTENGWETDVVLSQGNYEYKYVVDGKWAIDPSNPVVVGDGDFQNSFLPVDANVQFELKAFPNAKNVVVTGSFCDWNESFYKMTRKNDKWVFPIYLAPGKISYKFIVDGEWVRDPDNALFEENEFGTGNSVLWVK